MIAALAALLDRSVARIVEVSADGRYFDREQVATIAGIGDNNSVPLLGALAGRTRRIAIVAMARKLLIALWRYARTGLLPEGVEIGA